MDPYCRLYYRVDDWELVDLLLDGVHVDVSIVDVHAKAVMSQRFKNTFQHAVEAEYTFSMLARSAVCGFEMIRGDGTKVEGHVIEKKTAKKAYEDAKKEGKTTGLGEEQTKDLFTIKVGNILPSETVTINLTFLIPLTDDEKRDQLRFTFPRAYGSRYGTPPTAEAARASSTTGASQNFSINVSIQQAAAIKSVSCPSSHPIELSLGKPDDASVDSSVPDSNLASVKMLSPTPFLTQDFILVITAAGLDAPRCFIEPSKDGETTAIGISLVPRFKVPDVEGGMEYVFVVDRSGSMNGTPIKLVRQALIVLLRGLPTKNSSFNIFSFGSRANSLWWTSKDYSQKSLDEATAHVDIMEADYGGTEIAAALRLVFKSLPQTRQKSATIFLLTDGESWDINTCKDITSAATTSPGPSIRVFTVGIGGAVSTDTTESIAKAGDGMVIYVQDNEPMTGKLARLVRAARTPPVKDLEVLWPAAKDGDDDFEMVEKEKKAEVPRASQKISLFNEEDGEGDNDVGPPPKQDIKPTDVPVPSIQQAPLTIPGLFPGTRTEIYAIISTSSLQTNQLQAPIKVRGKIGGSGDIVELDIPLAQSLITQSATAGSGLIHMLAARAILTDREDNKHTFPSSISSKSSLLEAYLEADIIRIGTKYGLTSKHTSYIAIDERHPQQPLGSVRQPDQLPDLPRGGSAIARGVPMMMCMAAPPPPAVLSAGSSAGASYQPSSLSALSANAAMAIDEDDDDLLAEEVEESDEDMGFACFDDDGGGNYASRGISPPPSNQDTGLTALARLQQFDGRFASSERLFQILDVSSKFSDAPADQDVVATALALVWMRRESAEDGEDMIEKADEWLKDRVKENVYKELIEWAEKVFA